MAPTPIDVTPILDLVNVQDRPAEQWPEDRRLDALRALRIMDTPADPRFDRITRLAADLFDAPIVTVALLDDKRQWFKSACGVKDRETPRDWAICDHAIRLGRDEVMVIPDASADARFAESPLVAGPPHVRFYAGAVLTTHDGHALGTLCVIDTEPRTSFSTADAGRLRALADMVMDQIESARTELAAQEQVKLLHMAEAMSGVGHWRIDVPNGHVVWSDEVYRIHGVDRASFDPNLDVALRFYAPEDHATVNAHIQAAIERQQPFSFHLHIVRADGELRHVLSKAECEVAPDGSTLAIFGVFQDITDHVVAMEAVERSEARYRLLTENANDLVTEVDREGRVRYASPAILAMTGHTVEETVGSDVWRFVHPDDRQEVAAAVEAVWKGQPPRAIQYRLLCSSGAIKWVEARPTLARDASGDPSSITDVIRDITVRKATEAALAQSEARYRLLADNASDMISTFTPAGVITFISPGCRRILGYEPHELIGRRVLDLVHAEDQASVRAYYAAIIARGPRSTPEPFQFRGQRKDGRWIWLEGQPTIIYDPLTGRPASMQDVVRDISKRKELELQLQEARTAAESAAAVKSEFLSNMSHELRTPLTSILGFSSILQGTAGLSEQARRSVDRIAGSSKALLTIVNDILDFSKLEAGQLAIDRRACDVGQMLADAVGLLEFQADSKNLTLTLRTEGDLPPRLLIDDSRVTQVLLNLLSNAVKFTDAGGVTLASSYDPRAGRLRCAVADTGPGIPPDGLARLFQRFSQVDASSTRAHGGTGLGLAICKGLVEAMGGQIGARSTVGEGSVFWFDLPCAPPQEAADGAELDAWRTAMQHLDGLRLLVADDNPANRELVIRLLAGSAISVTEARTGEEAVTLAAQYPFDVILMDIRMPDRDGPSAAAAIREGRGPNDLTPIIAFTAESRDAVAAQSWFGLFDGQLSKPLIPAELLATLTEWADPPAPCEAADQASA